MAENSKIEWTTHTFNPWTGCTKVSPGCAHCYAEGWSKRSGIVKWGKGQPRRRTLDANWREPLKWDRDAAESGIRARVFCASLADWLDDEVPIEWLADLLDLIRLTPNLDWLLLTKRPENWQSRITAARNHFTPSNFETALWLNNWLPPSPVGKDCRETASGLIEKMVTPPHNVWIGTTVEDQTRAELRLPDLLVDIPARIRFLSCEPLLGPVNLSLRADRMDMPKGIDWIIAGGESGPGCRPFDPDWARSLRDQCAAAGVAFFMKQMGGARKPFPEIPEDLMIRQFPRGGAA